MNLKSHQKKSSWVVQQLKKAGCTFPVPVERVLQLLPGNPVHVIRELANQGYLENEELYQGTLPLGVARRLEKIGVLNRAMLSERLAAGKLNLDSISYVGRKRSAKILSWAKLEPSLEEKYQLRLKLPRRLIQELHQIAESPNYSAMDQSLRSLVEEILVVFKAQAQKSRPVTWNRIRIDQVR
jgi:hypothetical protein